MRSACVCDEAFEQPAPVPTPRPADGAPHDEVLRQVFDASPIAMALVCPQGRLVALNGSLCAVVGRRASELVGAPAVDVFHPDEQAAASTAMSDVLADGRIRRAENRRLRTAAGETRIVDVSVCAVEEPPTGVCVLVQDGRRDGSLPT